MIDESQPFFGAFARLARLLSNILLAISATSLVMLMLVVCADVVARMPPFNHPIRGALDYVAILGALTIGCSLPYTTAVKGHVAIEFFFHMLSARGRAVVDTIARVVVLVLFVFLTWEFIRYGGDLRANGQVTPTLQIPVFWICYFFSASCAVICMVKVYHLLRPGKVMIKP